MSRIKVPSLIIAGAVAVGFLLGSVLSNQVHAEGKLYGQLHVFTEILTSIQKYYVEEVDSEELVRSAIHGMLEELDPHSTYVEPEAFERMSERNSGEYEGIGISFEIRDGWITVITAIEGGPSAHLGIRPGDRIVEIEGETAYEMKSDDVVAKLKGRKGSKVNITVERPGIEKQFAYSIERDKIPIYSVPYAFMLDDGVTGYVRAIRFSATTSQELEESMRKLEAQGMERLVFDLRGNSGGYLNQAIEVADRFISGDQVIVYTKGRISGSSQHYYSTDQATHDAFPLIVLVNHGSASASEIVSGAIQDHDRGLVVGVTTFGKGLVQRQYSLGDGSALLLTVARYYTPSGRLIQRDYADREEYLDHFRRLNEDGGDVEESPAEDRPEYQTLNENRTVYGGGGISPDVHVEGDFDPTDTQVALEQFRTFFTFANGYAARNLNPAEWTVERFLSEFSLDDAGLEEFKTETLALEEPEVTREDLDAEDAYIRTAVKREIASNLWGNEARYRVMIADDNVLDEAITHFQEAAAMAQLYAKMEPND